MEYYLIYVKQPEAPLLIGTDNGFGVFWSDQGYHAFINIVMHQPKYLETIEIRNSENKVIPPSKFLDKIAKLKVRVS